MVSWWPGEGNGNDVASTNNGFLLGNVTFVPGEVGQAFSFDGATTEVHVPASASLNIGATGSGLTIECWIKPASLPSTGQPLVEWNNGSRYGVQFWHSLNFYGSGGPGGLYADIAESSGNGHYLVAPPGLLTTNDFQHVALTYDQASGVATIYVNGTTAAAENFGSFTPQTSYDQYFGHRFPPTIRSITPV
jgi:hypothetical protein